MSDPRIQVGDLVEMADEPIYRKDLQPGCKYLVVDAQCTRTYDVLVIMGPRGVLRTVGRHQVQGIDPSPAPNLDSNEVL